MSNKKEIRSNRPDGDNPTSLSINLESLSVYCYTDPSFPKPADIITLVEYYKDLSFTKAIYLICEICGYSYYSEYTYKKENIDPCLAFLKDVEFDEAEDEVPLRIVDEKMLNMYYDVPHWLFYVEGIGIDTQRKFEIGLSLKENCITIPIRDDLGALVGVKARTLLDYKALKSSKYWFPIKTPKTQILYGLDKTYDYIKATKSVIVFEGEKSVMKAWEMGIKNTVSIGGHDISSTQVMKLERLGVQEIILAYDTNVTVDEFKNEARKFILNNSLYAVIPIKNKGILSEKDAPIDAGKDYFRKLLKEDKYKIKI